MPTRPSLRISERIFGGFLRIEQPPLCGAPARGEADEAHAVGDRRIEVVEVLDAVNDVPGIVRDALEAHGIVGARAHEAQRGEAHVLHRAHGRADVHGILRLEKDDGDLRESGVRHS